MGAPPTAGVGGAGLAASSSIGDGGTSVGSGMRDGLTNLGTGMTAETKGGWFFFLSFLPISYGD